MSNVSFLKLMMMIEHIKMMKTPYFDIWSMLLLSNLFWNLKDPMLVQTLSYRMKVT